MTKKEKLAKLKEKMASDNSLPLKETATNLVFGDGNPEAEIVFVGEGPGHWEDVKGIPFVGAAGAFLNYLLSQIGIERKDVFITNVIHYRAPNNRDPSPAELEAFEPYLDKIIKIIKPKVVVTLGRFSMAKFMPNVMISKVHGKEKSIDWQGLDLLVVPMYHPAAALRNGMVKTQTIEDFKKLPEIVEKSKKEKKINTQEEEEKSKSEQMSLV